MATPADYLTSLHEKGVRLWVDDGKLRYRAKKGALSSEELARLRALKDGIIAELSRAAPVRAPLSFQQRWLLGLMKQHAQWKRTLGYALRLRGPLQPRILERSLERILEEHGSLRTRIVSVGEETWQEMDENHGLRLEVTLVSGDSAAERDRNALRLIQELTATHIDMARGPMMVAWLLRISEHDHILVLGFHRLVADCLSVGQSLRDLWSAYGEGLEGRPATVAVRAARYRDYAVWQQSTDPQWQQRHAGYWEGHLADAKYIRWPGAESGAGQGARGTLRSSQISLGNSLSAGLRDLGRQTKSLPALVVLAVYVGFVARWCGQLDFVMPFLIAGRHSEHEGAVGYFSHPLYLRITLNGNEGFPDLLKLVSNEFYRAVFRQDFGRVVRQRPELLIGSVCQWLSWHPREVAAPVSSDSTHANGFAVETVRFQTPEDLTNVPPAAVDLEMTFFEDGGDIGALCIYRNELFTEMTIARLMGQLQAVAEHFVRDPRAGVAVSPAKQSG